MDSIYSINIERAVLSSIFFNPEELEDVLGVLKPKDFYLPAHKAIFEAIVKLHSEDMPIDEDFVRNRVDKKDVNDGVLLEILSANPITNTAAYVKEIKDASVKRELATLATTIKKVAIEDEISANEALDTIQGELYKISTNSATSELKDMQTVTSDTLAYIEKMKKLGNRYLIGQTTGFEALDKKTTGFNEGDLVIIAARPAMGKTALVLNMALKNVEQKKGVIFFSLEMPAEQLMLRMLAAKTSIPLQNLRKGDMDDKEWSILSAAFDDLNSKKLFVDDGGSININQLRARVRKLAQIQENNISLVIIDYLQLMQGLGNKDRHQEVSDISRGLKMLARELKIPIVALSQLNRGLESRPDKRPMLSDLRESGAIEQDADIIMFVYRDDVYKQRDEARKEKEAKDKGEDYKSKFIDKPIEEAEIIIGKQRNGPIGTVKLDFHKALTKFIDKDNEHYGQAPIEVVFESVADVQKETKIDFPDGVL
ncbi:replicative DNA helicase [Aliarcobacter cryaerophilus]|jgi:replicative DNA helicase|uniref:Replicative DNA helicase n=3 Tax=Arcobacteraceae TaxID=2808963 RepID=A0AA46NBA9_9BACT|nr:replicative DNA helicase [Aliarcobacter cryaerophilus]WNL14455.1 replicative DNA helicase [Arcobacter sp. AZ-2023]WPD09625.1 replicative DNA helicase [Arcobacter sp. DSM 115954]MCT7463805.1 replicative DNA helicase [Aliarcobacter cryaerophilus]MCT7465589.1 replicative DNA helicase [Aliarcobacter cryaerophilus]MCT7467674.1 replicative DNA helicase [Aliarcobacter cryaerophilus]